MREQFLSGVCQLRLFLGDYVDDHGLQYGRQMIVHFMTRLRGEP